MPCNPFAVAYIPDKRESEVFVQEDGTVERGSRIMGNGKIGYTSHFATCPYADLHRRRK